MAIAIRGLLAGAKAVNRALSRRRSASSLALYFSFFLMPTTCAVPVLPPTVYCTPVKMRAAVPPCSLVTPTMARLMVSMFSCLSGMR
ncbi:hypothetical protein D3C72_2359330 [compost metagenome]